MKSIKINIANPKDQALDKVRVYLAGVDKNNGLFTEPHKIYEGILKEFIVAPRAVNKAKNYIGIEYFNDAGRVFRGLQPRAITVIDDMGPWEFLNKKITQGDDSLGILVNDGGVFPLPATIMHKHLYELYGKLIAAVASEDAVTAPEYSNTPQLEMFTVTVGGEIYAMSVVSQTNNTNRTLAQTLMKRAESMSATDKQINIGGFVWELTPIFFDFVDHFFPGLLHAHTNNSQTSINSKRPSTLTRLPYGVLNNYGYTNASVVTFKSRSEMLGNKQLYRVNGYTTDIKTNDVVYSMAIQSSTVASPIQFMLRYVGRAS